MIEVEIRGRLSRDEYENLKQFLAANGKFLGHHEREMYLLYDYPGYDHDPIKREVDIRLRNTDGNCEIMVKQKVSHGNVGRKEVSLKLHENNLEKAKEVLRYLGCRKGLRMFRAKVVYEYKGVEWSLVTTPKDYYYFEAEKAINDQSKVLETQSELEFLAKEMKLKVLTHEETAQFIEFLDREVNVEVDL